MRKSLQLFCFLCILCNTTYAQKIRLKSLQFGPTLSIQTVRPDTVMANIRQLVKDPQAFPRNSLDTLERDPGRGIMYGSAGGVQVSLLTAWEIGSNEKPVFRKEWRVGVEYGYMGNSQESWSTVNTMASPATTDQVSFRRQHHSLGFYTDFIFKKGVSRDRLTFFAGAGGYLSYSIGGRILENLSRGLYRISDASVDKFYHATERRRDIAILFPMGIEMRSANPRRPLGVSLGFRPGFMIVKEKNLASYVPGVLGFSVRLMYQIKRG